jgi:hypothetical protein
VFRCHVDPLARASRTAVRRPCSRWLATFVRARNPSFSDRIRKRHLVPSVSLRRRSWTSGTFDANRFLPRRYIGRKGIGEVTLWEMPSLRFGSASCCPPWLGKTGRRASRLFVHIPATKLTKWTFLATFFEYDYDSGIYSRGINLPSSYRSSRRVFCGLATTPNSASFLHFVADPRREQQWTGVSELQETIRFYEDRSE